MANTEQDFSRCESPPLCVDIDEMHSVAFKSVTDLCTNHGVCCCNVTCCTAILIMALEANHVPIPDLLNLTELVWKFKRARLLSQLEIGLRVYTPSFDNTQYTDCELLLDDVFGDIANRLDDTRRFCSTSIPTHLQERVERAVVGGLKMHLLNVPYIGVEKMLLKLNIDGLSFDVATDDAYATLIVIKKQMNGIRMALFEAQHVEYEKEKEKQNKKEENIEKQKKNKKQENEKKKEEDIDLEFEPIKLRCCMCSRHLGDCHCGSTVESQGVLDGIFSIGGSSGGEAVGSILQQLKNLNQNIQGLEKHVTVIVTVILLVASIWASIRFIDLTLHKGVWDVVKSLLIGAVGICTAFGVSHFLVNAIMGLQDDATIVSQSGFDLSLKPLSGLMVATAAVVSGVKATGAASVESLLKSCETFKRRAEGLDSVRVWLIDFFEWAINFVRIRILGKAPICLQRLGDSDCTSWVDKTMEIVELASKEKFPITTKNAETIAMHILAGKELQANLMKRGASTAASGFTQFSRMLEYLKEIEGPFKRACCTMSGLRVRPTIILLSGAPGVGKTQVALPLICRIGPSILPKEDLAEFQQDYMHYVYVRNAETKYWDGYAPHKIFMVVDDFMQARDVAGNPDNEIMDIIRCGSAFPNMLHMADLADKGNTMFRSQIILCTSNTIDFKPNSIVEPEALNRRFDIMVKVVPRVEFCTPETKDKEIESRRLDVTKVDGVCDTSVYEFHLMEYIDGHLRQNEVIDYFTLCSRVIDLGRQRQREFTDYAKRTKDEIKAGIVDASKKDIEEKRAVLNMLKLEDVASKMDIPKVSAAPVVESQGLWAIFKKERAKRRQRDEGHRFQRQVLSSLLPSVMNLYNFESPASLAQIDEFFMTQSISQLENLIHELVSENSEQVQICLNYIASVSYNLKPTKVLNPGRMQAIWNDMKTFKDCLKEWFETETQLIRIGALVLAAIGAIGVGVLAWKMVSVVKDKIKKIKEKKNLLGNGEIQTLLLNVSDHVSFYCTKDCQGLMKKYLDLLLMFNVVDQDYLNVSELREGFYYHGDVAFYYSRNLASHDDPNIHKALENIVTDGLKQVYRMPNGDAIPIKFWTWTAGEVYPVESDYGTTVKSESESYSNNAGTRYQRDAKIANLRKMNIARGGHIVRSEMDWNTSAHSQALPAFGRNTCQIESEEGQIAGTITFLTDRYFIINTHYYWTFVEDKDKSLILSNKSRKLKFKLPVSSICSRTPTPEEISRDWMLRRAPLTVQPFRNIIDLFIERNDPIVTLARTEVAFLGLREGETWTNNSTAMKQPVKVEEPREIMINECYAHNTPTARGDCGSWLIYSGPRSGNLKILGLHAAGTAMGPAYATCVYREDVKAELVLLDPEFSKQGQPIISQAFPIALTSDKQEFNGFETLFECVPGQQTCDFTEKMPSRFQNSWGISSRKPARLRPFERDGVIIDPLALAISKYSVPPICLRVEHLSEACNDYLSYMEQQSLRDFLRTVLSYEAGVLGFPGMDYHNAVQRTTSAGFPFSLHSRPTFKGKQIFFGKAIDFDLSGDHAKILEERVHDIIDGAGKGIRRIHVFTDNLKDELRPIEKVNAGKTRLFSGAPLDYTIAVRMYYLDFMAWIMTNRIMNGIAVGVNPYSTDWTAMVHYLTAYGNNFIAGDFSSFDAHLSSELLIKVGDLIDTWYSDGNTQVRGILWQEVYNSRHIAKKTIYEWRFGLPSGHPMTTIINCIANQMMFRCAFLKLCPGVPFDDHVRLVVYGDDNILGVSDLVIERFNQLTLTEFFADAGITYTMEDKSSKVEKYRKLEEVSFLKRGFAKHPLLPGTFAAPLDLETILDIPRWTSSSSNRYSIEHDNTIECLNELSLHGYTVYQEWAPKIHKAVGKFFPDLKEPVDLHSAWKARLQKVSSLDKVF